MKFSGKKYKIKWDFQINECLLEIYTNKLLAKLINELKHVVSS